ncbi:S-adenosyl-L-methionine-dependent methyltransferase [Dactylonectria estremocensis]|uniref:S-adenosyl-L-methionine-dependent methyltransferase n=1 Tax=Dactylonectria estremocensis TaxID=1079267 RepID=A0A9P9IHA9_9HYPO|nr:S-adenosyl-L-methionine-dependent methyltransferase [Dactylonectria estremocensis]
MSKSPPRKEAGSKPASPSKTASPASQTAPDTEILPPQHWAQLTEELEQDDTDSAFTDRPSSTESLSPSILQYRTAHGRTYHSERGNADYWGPIDDTQQEAMDINHHVLVLLLYSKLHLAPLSKDIQSAVDIGTGTGMRARDFADQYPNALVVGTDLAPIQPSWVPPNVQFQIDDCTQNWTFQSESLDYVHMRWLVGSIQDWTVLFEQAYKSLKPGGYLESYEPSSRLESDDGSVLEASALSQWGKFFVEGGRKLGRPFTIFDDGIQRKAMEEAGFVDIEEHDVKNPIGGWPKDPMYRDIGLYMQSAFEQDAKGTVLHMATILGWTEDEVTVFVSHFRREMRTGSIHPFFRQKVVWGRKPTKV